MSDTNEAMAARLVERLESVSGHRPFWEIAVKPCDGLRRSSEQRPAACSERGAAAS
ncbi:hypothetical protein [Glycomyces tarimensis]